MHEIRKKDDISAASILMLFVFYLPIVYPTVLQTCNAELVEYSVKLLFNQYYLKRWVKSFCNCDEGIPNIPTASGLLVGSVLTLV